ncbi:MAG TPA: hypothetical protein VHO25_01335 [Polyangiaceae bacterium]|nr:hypothetical protein [Polyangiaceae bacterium]
MDFGEEVAISGVVLRTIFESGEGYVVTLDSEVMAVGNGPTSLSGGFELHWPVARGRTLRISQSGSSPGSFWSVYDLYPVCQ